jgi:Gamma-glutamyl cyclotransferase, AIG2-like
MDPTTLAKVLHLEERPILRPAKIIGYRCLLWGPYPALIDGKSGMSVTGVAYDVQAKKMKSA